MPLSHEERAIRKTLEWQFSPLQWVREVLGETPTFQQEAALIEWGLLIRAKVKSAKGSELSDEEKPYQHKLGMSIQSGQDSGKTHFAGWIGLHMHVCFPYSKVRVTAPAGPQIDSVMWPEFHKLIRGSELLKASITHRAQKIYRTAEGPAEWFIEPRTIQKNSSPDEQAEVLGGLHEKYMVMIADEACHDDETDVLTEQGWMRFAELESQPQLRVLTIDPETRIAEYQHVTKFHRYPFDGDLYAYDRRNGSFALTAKHTMWYRAKVHGRRWQWYKKSIQDVGAEKMYIPRLFSWQGKEQEQFILPAAPHRPPGKKYFPCVLPMDAFLALLGWYLSEGSVQYRTSGIPSAVSISQSLKHPAQREDIKRAISQSGFKVRECGRDILCGSVQLATYLSTLGRTALTKHIPSFIRDLSPRQIKIFLAAFHAGDGYWKDGARIFYTSSLQLADGLQELILKSGQYASLCTRRLKGQRRWIVDHWGTSSVDGFVLREYVDESHLTIRRKHIQKQPYQGNVYCVEVPPHHLLYTRRNGKCMWSGNTGVPDPVFKPLEGGLGGVCNLILLIFNPTRSHGYAMESQSKFRKHWVCHHWDCEELAKTNPVFAPHMAQDHARIAEKYGKESNFYRIRVKGLPPLAAPDILIPTDWVMDAMEREAEIDPLEPLTIGVDVGGGGEDQTVIIPGRGHIIIPHSLSMPIFAVQGIDTTQIGWKVEGCLRELLADEEGQYGIAIDVIGIGAGVYSHLTRIAQLRNIIEVNVAEMPSDNTRFHRLRDQLWWELREVFEKRLISLPKDDDLFAELTDLHWTEESGKIKVEGKKELRKRGVKSPNKADALCLREYARRYCVSRVARPARRSMKREVAVPWQCT